MDQKTINELGKYAISTLNTELMKPTFVNVGNDLIKSGLIVVLFGNAEKNDRG